MSEILPFENTRLSTEKRAQDLLSRLSLEEKISLLIFENPSIETLGIPSYNWCNECIHGVARAGKATVFPQVIGLAAMFNERMIEDIGEAISDEARVKYAKAILKGKRGIYQGITFLSPNINIFRDPRWGRGQETYGEDPFLTGTLASRFIRTLQQEKRGVMKAAACAKHFAAHSGPEADKHSFNAKVTPQDLRETYLPAFKMCVNAGVEIIMTAYNGINNIPAAINEELLVNILRKEWDFNGCVISECGAIEDLHKNHKITETPAKSAARAIKSGTDLNFGYAYKALNDAIDLNLLEEKDIDQALKRVITTQIKLGMLDKTAENPWGNIPFSLIDSEKHRALALITAKQSIVLLKNNKKTLPLSPNIERLFVTGPNAANINALLGDYHGINGRMITPLEGLTNTISNTTTIDYRRGALIHNKINNNNYESLKQANFDAIIAFMGLDNTMEGDESEAQASTSYGDRLDINFPKDQLKYLKELKKTEKPLIVVVNSGGPLIMKEVEEIADAILWSWYPGEEGGNALAEIIFGLSSPAGRLPVTFPKNTKQIPPFEDYSMKGRTYRFLKEQPQYPFGFGLSYTTFRYSNLQINKKSLSKEFTLEVTVDVQNNGPRDSEEVVQLYISYPKAPFRTPLYDLRGFKRIMLVSKETQNLHFTLKPEHLQNFNTDGVPVLLEGEYTITLGNCSPGSRGQDLGAAIPCISKFTVK